MIRKRLALVPITFIRPHETMNITKAEVYFKV